LLSVCLSIHENIALSNAKKANYIYFNHFN
jgi:hypothetical protein